MRVLCEKTDFFEKKEEKIKKIIFFDEICYKKPVENVKVRVKEGKVWINFKRIEEFADKNVKVRVKKRKNKENFFNNAIKVRDMEFYRKRKTRKEHKREVFI